jgi:hypothetical protein
MLLFGVDDGVWRAAVGDPLGLDDDGPRVAVVVAGGAIVVAPAPLPLAGPEVPVGA